MKKILLAFTNAFNGLRYTLVHERNVKIELFCAFVTISCAFIFKISKLEWFVVIVNTAAVLTAELFNTAIENLCDMIHKTTHPIIKIVKDVSAAAVVITALCALICGCIIFIPYFLKLI